MNTKKKTQEYTTYKSLNNHPFVSTSLSYAMRIVALIVKKGTLLKTKHEYKRLLSRSEYYCISVGTALSYVLSVCRQLEHSVLFFSSFSPTRKMKNAGIKRHDHIVYCVENYIIRTQSMYDRLLRLIDTVFELYNPSHLISHELVIRNTHVKHSSIPDKLKKFRKVIKDYYRDRQLIIHETGLLEDQLHRLDAYTILLTSEGPMKGNKALIEEANNLIRKIVKNKTKEFSAVNHDSFIVLGDIFTDLEKEYKSKRNILEANYGTPELAPIPKIVTYKIIK